MKTDALLKELLSSNHKLNQILDILKDLNEFSQDQ